MFYSINNTQHGLVGLDLGKALILDVMKVIQQDDPRIKFFATLSPIPGLWEGYLERILVGGDASFQLNRIWAKHFFPDSVQEDLVRLHNHRTGGEAPDFATALHEILDDERWIHDTGYVSRLTSRSLSLCTSISVKRRTDREASEPGRRLSPGKRGSGPQGQC